MAPVTSSVLAGLMLLSQTSAVKLMSTHFSGFVYKLDLTFQSPTQGTLKVDSKKSGCGVTPAWLTLEPVTDTVYCIDESWQGSGWISEWKLDNSSTAQEVNLKARAPTPGNSVHGELYGGKDGRSFIITSEYSPSTITTYKLPITSSTKALQTLEFTMAAPGPRPDRQDKPHPHAAFTDPTGNFMIVPDLGADLTRIFAVNKDTGLLTECPAIPSLPGDGPRHGLFRRTTGGYGEGQLKYYSLNEVSSSVGVYDVVYPSRRPRARGTKGKPGKADCLSLKLTQTLGTYGPGVALGNVTVKSAEIRTVGPYLYASNRNDSTFGKEQDSIAIFKIGADGKLAFQELTNSFGYYPRSFAFNKAGTYAAIAGQTTANIAIVARDAATGKLGPKVADIVLEPRGTYGGEDGISSVIWLEG